MKSGTDLDLIFFLKTMVSKLKGFVILRSNVSLIATFYAAARWHRSTYHRIARNEYISTYVAEYYQSLY